MQKLIWLVLFNTICFTCYSQFGNSWVTGYSGNRILFNGSTISTSIGLNPQKYFTAGHSSISDSLGNLLLYSNGFHIFNKVGGYLDKGDTLVPHYYFDIQSGSSFLSQTSIFLPMDSNIYYFITPTFSDLRYDDCHNNSGNCYFDLLLYNVVDMNANGGAGKVIKRMQPLMENANLRKTQMMACKHGNGTDWWLLKNEGDNGDVHTFLVTKDSIYDKGLQSFANPTWGAWDIRGQSTFNSDGSMFATTSHGGSSGLIFIANFDRCYGMLSNPRTIQMPSYSQHLPWDTSIMERLAVGLAFSPNSQFLYVISQCNIHQFDLSDNSWYHVSGLDTIPNKFQEYETCYMGPDNRIYIGNFGGLSKQMSRIDNPDVKGAGCAFCPRCLRLDSLGSTAYVGTPPCMPNYSLGAKTCWPLSNEQLILNNEQWALYPNPVNAILYIKNAKGKVKKLYNLYGQLLISTAKEEMDISGLPKGLYFLSCEQQTQKVLVE